MKKGYYIYCKGNTEFVGVEKKINDQIRALNISLNCQKIVLYREEYQLFKSIIWRLPFGSFGRRYDQVWEQIENPDYFYIRFILVDRKFLRFIKELRARFPKCKIIIEVPTYPYIHEWRSAPSMLPFYLKDMWHSRKLKKYVDRIVTFSDDNMIFGIPTIRIMNGIWMDSIEVSCKSDNGDIIVLLAVAQFQPSHGYERCIHGLANYYNNGGRRMIELHMVGYGGELSFYQNLVKKLHLESYVFFHGKKTRDELEQFYAMTDIALGVFGAYKNKIFKISALKTREYLAYGLPIISGCREDVFDNSNVDFYYVFPNEDSPIDMEKVICFYDQLYKSDENRQDVANRIRDFANETIDMKITMGPIIDYLL